MAEKLIVIGGTAAGLSAASKAKRVKPDLEIQVFEKTGYISYGSCGLPYFVGGLIPKPEDLVAVTAEVMKEKRGISTWTHHEVTAIQRREKTVCVRNLETGRMDTHAYDKLVIATGAVPFVPPVKGIHSDSVYFLRTVEDGIRLKEAVLSGLGFACRACIIGGGMIGLEMAEELTQAGMQVTVLEPLPRLLPFLEPVFSQSILENLEHHGVTVLTETGVEMISAESNASGQILTLGGNGAGGRKSRTVEADVILVSAGVVPSARLAGDSGLELGLRGGIVVDDAMQTSDPHIWACGDCVQMKNMVTGHPVYVPSGPVANKQGRIAGANAAGACETFKGVLGSMAAKLFEQYIASTGLSVKQAGEAGFHPVSTVITKSDRASYYPGGKDNQLCLIFDRYTGRLLGAQGLGSESIAGRINVLAAAVTCSMTVEEVSELDLVYAPPVAPVYDPILIAAGQAVKKVVGNEERAGGYGGKE